MTDQMFLLLVILRPTLLLENYQPWLDLQVPSKVDVSLSEVQYDAYISYCFNLYLFFITFLFFFTLFYIYCFVFPYLCTFLNYFALFRMYFIVNIT